MPSRWTTLFEAWVVPKSNHPSAGLDSNAKPLNHPIRNLNRFRTQKKKRKRKKIIINARHSAQKKYTSITINTVSQNKFTSLISCVSKHMSVCMCAYKGSFVHAHIPIHKMHFLCTNMFAKYVMHPKTYNGI